MMAVKGNAFNYAEDDQQTQVTATRLNAMNGKKPFNINEASGIQRRAVNQTHW